MPGSRPGPARQAASPLEISKFLRPRDLAFQEKSDWAAMEILTWNRDLSFEEMDIPMETGLIVLSVPAYYYCLALRTASQGMISILRDVFVCECDRA